MARVPASSVACVRRYLCLVPQQSQGLPLPPRLQCKPVAKRGGVHPGNGAGLRKTIQGQQLRDVPSAVSIFNAQDRASGQLMYTSRRANESASGKTPRIHSFPSQVNDSAIGLHGHAPLLNGAFDDSGVRDGTELDVCRGYGNRWTGSADLARSAKGAGVT